MPKGTYRDTVVYFNGKTYKRRVRPMAFSKLHVRLTFAYRGIPQEWPAVISYSIR